MSGATLAVYLANAGILGLMFLYAFARRRTYSMFIAGLFAVHLASALETQNFLDQFGPQVIFRGQMLLLSGIVSLALSLLLLDPVLRWAVQPALLTRATASTAPNATQRRFALVMGGAAAVAVAIIMRNGFELLERGWEVQREYSNFLDSFAVMLGFILAPATWIAVRWRRWFLALALGAVAMLILLAYGSRAMLMTLVGLMVLNVVWLAWPLRRKLALLAVCGVVALSLHTGLRITRALGIEGFTVMVQGGTVDWGGLFEGQDVSGGESSIYGYYYYVVKAERPLARDRFGLTFVRLVMMYIPRSVVGEWKPLDITNLLWLDALNDGFLKDNDPGAQNFENVAFEGTYGSIHPTFWGDAYATLGSVGPTLYGIGMALILVLIEGLFMHVPAPAGAIFMAIAAAGYLMMARGNIIVGAGYFAYIIPIALLLFGASGLLRTRERA